MKYLVVKLAKDRKKETKKEEKKKRNQNVECLAVKA